MKKKISLFILFSFFVPSQILASSLGYQLSGHFLIQTDNLGEIWYVEKRFHSKNQIHKFNDLAELAIGISDHDLIKIPIAINENLTLVDSDADGLDDLLELAIGTDPFKADSDNDSYSDSLELRHHFNPLDKGRLPINLKFSKKIAGQIVLQVEQSGELWYINPVDSLRYYLPNEKYFKKTMAYIAQGINNNDLDLIINNQEINQEMTKNLKVDVGSSQTLSYYLNDLKLGSFKISSGKASTPTPLGHYQVINKHPKAWSPFGLWMPYWLGLGTGRFGFHELPIWPNGYREGESHLGIPVSAGCIRLGIGPAKFIYDFAEIGMPVEIVKN